MYRITITKISPNPEYEDQLEEFREANKYNNAFQEKGCRPTKNIEKKCLESTIEDEEFVAVKKALIDSIK